MTLPNFLIIGAQKAGTTWLNWKLRQHPEVYMPAEEIHFFDNEINYRRGIEWYSSHFANVQNKLAVGEKTPDYLASQVKPINGQLIEIDKRIYQALPDVKLIISLRNPVDRAVSATAHMIRMGQIAPTHDIDDLLMGSKQHLLKKYGIFEYGRYYDQLLPYFKRFGNDQTLVLIFEEDVVAKPTTGMAKVTEFLGIGEDFFFSDLSKKENAYNHSRFRLLVNYYFPLMNPIAKRINRFLPVYKPVPNQRTIEYLYDYYKEDNQKLFELLGQTPTSWKLSVKHE